MSLNFSNKKINNPVPWHHHTRKMALSSKPHKRCGINLTNVIIFIMIRQKCSLGSFIRLKLVNGVRPSLWWRNKNLNADTLPVPCDTDQMNTCLQEQNFHSLKQRLYNDNICYTFGKHARRPRDRNIWHENHPTGLNYNWKLGQNANKNKKVHWMCQA